MPNDCKEADQKAKNWLANRQLSYVWKAMLQIFILFLNYMYLNTTFHFKHEAAFLQSSKKALTVQYISLIR